MLITIAALAAAAALGIWVAMKNEVAARQGQENSWQQTVENHKNLNNLTADK